ncbi:MAG TPA: SapC family protein, partial [Desulfomicrobiaceae bacterium]|nr:SapC family protein [Desulfomicrobiaceae bacterium]
DSGAVTEGEGERLFDDEGKPGPALNRAMEFLKEFQAQAQAGAALGALLRKHDLLVPATVAVQDGEDRKQIRLEGVAVVDEKRLNDLENELFLELRRAGALPLIYMHLLSQRILPAMFQNVNAAAPAPSTNSRATFDESGEEADSFDFSRL